MTTTTDQAPDVNAYGTSAKAAHDPLLPARLTCVRRPARAIALAAILRAHPHPMPHWLRWADELQTWGEQHMEAEP